MMSLTLIACLLLFAGPEPADAWPGLFGDGSSQSAGALPLRWSPMENVAWRAELPGYGQSSPVVWGGRVFVTSVEGDQKERCLVTAIDSATGTIDWRKEFAAGRKGPNNSMTSRAAPTPVVDADGLYVLFESGDLFGMTHNGDLRWERSLGDDYGDFINPHGLGSSLAQTDDTVIALVDHGGPSYLLAVDKATGETRWKAERTGGFSWTSPVVTNYAGRTVVLTSGGGRAGCYDAASGESLWEADGVGGGADIPSPAIGDGLAVFVAGENQLRPGSSERPTILCVRLNDEDGRPGYETLWAAKKPLGHTASPLIHRGCVYVVTRIGILHCLDARTGMTSYVERLGEPCWATPIAAGDHVYFFGKEGTTTVIKAGPAFERVATNRLWTDAEFLAAKEAGQLNPQNRLTVPPQMAGKMTQEEMNAMTGEAVGQVVYAAAAASDSIYFRSGSELTRVCRGR